MAYTVSVASGCSGATLGLPGIALGDRVLRLHGSPLMTQVTFSQYYALLEACIHVHHLRQDDKGSAENCSECDIVGKDYDTLQSIGHVYGSARLWRTPYLLHDVHALGHGAEDDVLA